MKEAMALFEHDLCGSTFFAGLKREEPPVYRGRCPNPYCNRQVLAFAKELFPSTDYARRAYIRAVRKETNDIYWQAQENETDKAA